MRARVDGDPAKFGMYSRTGRRIMQGWPADMRVLCSVLGDVQTRCWNWTGQLDRTGYGKIKFEGRSWRAHRLAWTALRGPISDDLTIDHLCRNRKCCNPNHLEPVPIRVNILRSEGVTAKNLRATHCVAGHPLNGDNLYAYKNQRRCRECDRRRAREYQRNKRKAA